MSDKRYTEESKVEAIKQITEEIRQRLAEPPADDTKAVAQFGLDFATYNAGN